MLNNLQVLQGVQEKLCFFTIQCNPSLAYIAVKDLQNSQRNASVQSLLWAGTTNSSRVQARERKKKLSRILFFTQLLFCFLWICCFATFGSTLKLELVGNLRIFLENYPLMPKTTSANMYVMSESYVRYRVFINYCVFFQEFLKVCHLSLANTRLLLVEQKITRSLTAM